MSNQKQLSDIVNDIALQYQKKIEQAIRSAEPKIKAEMEKVIIEYMTLNYYNGYSPKMYERTFQLPNSVGPYTDVASVGGLSSITFGVDTDSPFGPGAMDHKFLALHVSYKQKKTGRTVNKTYYYETNTVNEQIIFDNFMAGIHPGVGNHGTSPVYSATDKQLDKLLHSVIIDILDKQIKNIKIK